MTERKSLEPSVFRVSNDAENDILIGSKCKKCQRVFFPPREWCAACLEPTCEEVELSREGEMEAFSLVERKQDYALIEAPYVLGEIKLPEGPHVYTSIGAKSEESLGGIRLYCSYNEENLGELKRGQKVKLKPVVVKKDEEGNDIVAYNFEVMEK